MIIELTDSHRKIISFNSTVSKACIVLSVLSCYFALLSSAFSLLNHAGFSFPIISVMAFIMLYVVWFFSLKIDENAIDNGKTGFKRFMFIIFSCGLSVLMLLNYFHILLILL